MPQTLAQMVRAKHSGAYDDLSDQELESRIRTRFPGVYDDLPTSPDVLHDPNRKPVSAEDFAPPQRDVSISNMLWNTVKSFNPVPGIKALAADQRPEDVALGPGGQVVGPLLRAAGAGAASEARKTAEEVRHGRISEAAGHAVATVLPLVGPAAAQAGEDIGSGDTERMERGGGTALGLVGGMLAPGAVRTVGPKVAPALATIGEQLAAKGKAVTSAVGNVNPLVLDIAGEVAGHALGAQLGVPTLARRVLAHVLESSRKPAAANAGGRVVPSQTPSLTEALTEALEDVRTPQPPARVTTAPEASLPPGYTPRSTVPKPKLVKPERPAAPPTTQPARRAYFLKSPEELAAVADEAVTPSGSITTSDLPASWQSHTGQDIFPITGEEGRAVIEGMRAELKARGLSVGEAIASVSKNKAIPVQIRTQLLRALSGGK